MPVDNRSNTRHDDPDVVAIDRLLDSLKPPTFTTTTLDRLRRELRVAEAALLALIPPEGCPAEVAQAARGAIQHHVDAFVALLDGPLDAPSSCFTRAARPLGSVENLEGRVIEIDELAAWEILQRGTGELMNTADLARRVKIRELLIAVLRKLVPGQGGSLPDRAERRWEDICPVPADRLLAIYEQIHARVAARGKDRPLPDRWNASDKAEDGTSLGFSDMAPAEVTCRLIGWALSRAHGRVGELVNMARRLTSN